MTGLSKLPISAIGRIARAKTTRDKEWAFVKYRDERPMKSIERWLSRPAKVHVNVSDEARNVYFRPAKPILLWSSSHADRRRSTEIGYIDFVSRWDTCVCTSGAAEDAGVSYPLVNRLSLEPAAISRSSDIFVKLLLTNNFFAARKYIYIRKVDSGLKHERYSCD